MVGTAIVFTALLSVGLTAETDSPFSIAIRPVFMRVDPAAIAESRARILGIDVDIKLGSMYLHFGWSPIPLISPSTKPGDSVF